MQTLRAPFLVSSLAAALVLSASPLLAADKSTDSQNQTSAQGKPADARSAKDAEKKWEQQHRASKLIGSDIMNVRGEKVGTVKDLVLDDPASGQVTRVVVSVGGMGGLGDKLFAVPFNELHRDPAKDTLVLNANSDLAHAFNNDNWQTLGNQATSSTASATPSPEGSTPATDTSGNTASSAFPSSAPASSTPASSTPATPTPASTTPATTSPVFTPPASTDTGNPVISGPATSDTSTAK